VLSARWGPEQLQQQEAREQLDWSVVVDRPHGSFRLLGSQKAWWMVKGEPKWVYVKSYSPAKWDGERWVTLPVTHDIISR
jgi:hypothetical protein